MLVGTSGWSYPHWRGGVFYPRELPAARGLPFYARRFVTVEINSSFYRPPEERRFAAWADATPGGFVFAVKAPRSVTHDLRLEGVRDAIEPFLAATVGLGAKRGPLLVQLPPSFGRRLDVLERFLDGLRDLPASEGLRVAVEFRNRSWLVAEVRRALDRRGVALVLADKPGARTDEPNDAGFVYVRRHGHRGRADGGYPPDAIAADAARIRGFAASGREVFVYYNNDLGGHAVVDALALRAALGDLAPAPPRPPRQGRLF